MKRQASGTPRLNLEYVPFAIPCPSKKLT
jgi:hypothetical protein